MSQSQSQSQSISLNRVARPMLARVADNIYWMARYVERAEHLARVMLVNSNVLLDVADLAPELEKNLWLSILKIINLDQTTDAQDILADGTGSVARRLGAFIAFDSRNPDSLLTCLAKARENARVIRENISAEMWESLNTLYWSLNSEDAKMRFEEAPQELYRAVMNGSFLFQGLTDQTMAHAQPWRFAHLAKHLERTDLTCRILSSRFAVLHEAEGTLETALKNIHWMAVLRSCCSIEAYRRMNSADFEPNRIAAFLLLECNFPRSVCYSVRHAYRAISDIRSSAKPNAMDPAERTLARLSAQLENMDPNEIFMEGLEAFILRILEQVATAANFVQRSYFLRIVQT